MESRAWHWVLLRGLALLLTLASGCAAAGDDLAARIAAAADDPALVVPALVEGSARLGEGALDADALALADRLALLARRAFCSPERLPGMQRLGLRLHRVAPGELPGAILKRYGMRASLLELLNDDYDERRLRAGQELKVCDLRAMELRVVVRKAGYRCLVFARRPQSGPLLIAALPVGIGSEDRPTPVGRSAVRVLVRDPEWTHPDSGEVIPPRDPRNLLGGYWIGLQVGDDERFRGIGLHGYTGEPSERWLERPGSRGCLRLLQDDIHALYCLLSPGVGVWIEE